MSCRRLLAGPTASPPRSRCAACATSATTRPRPEATRPGSEPRARSTSSWSRFGWATSPSTRSPSSTASTPPTPGRSSPRTRCERAFELTAGQPWLVNALAREIVEKIRGAGHRTDHGRPRGAGQGTADPRPGDSPGLARRPARRPARPPSARTSPRRHARHPRPLRRRRRLHPRPRPDRPRKPLSGRQPHLPRGHRPGSAAGVEDNVIADPRSFVLPDGRLDFPLLLDEFADFWIEHGDILRHGSVYHEAAPQLVLMGFLQRVVNGGGYVEREYGVGPGRIDLLVRWPYDRPRRQTPLAARGPRAQGPRLGEANPLADGLNQLDRYLDRLGLDTGTLVVFDRRPNAHRSRNAFISTRSPVPPDAPLLSSTANPSLRAKDGTGRRRARTPGQRSGEMRCDRPGGSAPGATVTVRVPPSPPSPGATTSAAPSPSQSAWFFAPDTGPGGVTAILTRASSRQDGTSRRTIQARSDGGRFRHGPTWKSAQPWRSAYAQASAGVGNAATTSTTNPAEVRCTAA